MYIYDDGIKLAAELDLPEGLEPIYTGEGGARIRISDFDGKKLPICVLLHGFTGWKEEPHILGIAKAMNEMGLAVLRVDMYGHGHSDGEFKNHDLRKWIGNAMAAIDYARSLDFAGDIYLSGHSQGGLCTILTAAIMKDRLKGIIPLAPATVIMDMVNSGSFFGIPMAGGIPEEITLPGKGLRLSGNYARVALQLDYHKAIAAYEGPVLIVHGDADEAVPVAYAYQAAEEYKNCELAIIPGDSHCYDYHLDQVCEAVKAWLKKQL